MSTRESIWLVIANDRVIFRGQEGPAVSFARAFGRNDCELFQAAREVLREVRPIRALHSV